MSGSMGGKEGKEDEEEGKGRRKEGEEERRRQGAALDRSVQPQRSAPGCVSSTVSC